MSTMNLLRRLRELSPGTPLLIAEVIAVHEDQTSTVQYPDGSVQRVRGTIVAVGGSAFVRNGIIEQAAPSRTMIVQEI